LLKNANTRAGDAGLGSPLVRWPPNRECMVAPSPRPADDRPPGRAIYLAPWPSPRRCAARCRPRRTRFSPTG